MEIDENNINSYSKIRAENKPRYQQKPQAKTHFFGLKSLGYNTKMSMDEKLKYSLLRGELVDNQSIWTR